MARDDIGSWTIVIDDVEGINFGVESKHRLRDHQPAFENALARFFPECSHGSLIFLTQSQSLSKQLSEGSAATLIEVTPLSAKESLRMMETCLGQVEEQPQLIELTHLLGHSPLAMKQAAGCIRDGGFGLREYISQFEAQPGASLAAKIVPPGLTSHYGKVDLPNGACIPALAISCQQLIQKDVNTLKLLYLATFYDSHAIPVSVFEVLREPSAVARSLRILESFCLIEYNLDDEFIDVHGVVRSLVRVRLFKSGEDLEWILHASKSLFYLCPTGESLDLGVCAMLLPHILSILEHSTILDDLTRSNLLSNAGLYFRSQGQWENAIRVEFDSLKLRRRLPDAGNPSILTSMDNLASLYANTGQWAKATQLQETLVQESRKLLGSKHPDTLNRLAGLATAYKSEGRYLEAEAIEEDILDKYLVNNGPEHPSTLTSMTNLAFTYSLRGDLTKAENLATQGTETIQKTLGTQHPDTLRSKAALASILVAQGKFTKAEQLERSILATSTELLGQKHPDTLSSMSNLAVICSKMGRWVDAERLETQVLQANLTILGSDHPHTLTSMNNLAMAYLNQGRWEEAEKLQTHVKEKMSEALGAEHPDTLSIMGNLALIYRNQGRRKEAEKLRGQVREMSERVLGPEHPDTLKNLHNLAMTYWKQERYGVAMERMDKVITLRSFSIGPHHPDTRDSIRLLEKWFGIVRNRIIDMRTGGRFISSAQKINDSLTYRPSSSSNRSMSSL